ncbi:MAG: type IV pilus twitching motility protein PilT [Eubacteriaceae bacterium]
MNDQNNSFPEIAELVKEGRKQGCSDIHLTKDGPPMFRKNGELIKSVYAKHPLMAENNIFSLLNEEKKAELIQGNDLDFTYISPDGFRQRVNVYKQQGCYTAAIRLLNETIPSLEGLKLPRVIQSLSNESQGLILVTGPTGSGKTTTLAAMVDHINTHKAKHILTIEDPIEYQYQHKKSMVHQREVGTDVVSFKEALRSSLREDPDVILVGEMRDYETMSAALTAAETGHLVLSTLHTTGAAKTIDRILDGFPMGSQQQIRTQLAGVLKGIISQQLIPSQTKEGRILGLEILIGTEGVLNLIREGKTHLLETLMQTSAKEGMITLNGHLTQLVKERKIAYEEGLKWSNDRETFRQYF